MGIIKLRPAYKDYLWGGTNLKTKFSKQTDMQPLAESWELSTHPDGPSVVASGPRAGLSFPQYLQKAGAGVLGERAKKFDRFPLLIKFIDAKQSLSVQVHPSDEYALREEHEYGKTEVWYIVDCEKDAFLYYGVRRETTREEFQKAVREDTVCDLLNRVPVHRGDVFFIPAGTLHAIGAGILICEIQQNSNSTYRVYDFGRRDAQGNLRELHLEKALAVASLEPAAPDAPPAAERRGADGALHLPLARCPYFTAERLRCEGSVTIDVDGGSFASLVILEGAGAAACGRDSLPFRAGDSLFVPAGAGAVTLEGAQTLIKTTI